ncbi:hypothetical protein B0H66DRAFT_627670 [Apodospora peruviana]|uniref:Uncharacterized protein n=1 Tax=Apodospora peruviana TaxID=516989 RepID=A0AAE0HXX9_9PEZI|nr:hypothetical protein B0H66DRAFT_627670 [Apodospora peruviana]
MPPSPPRKGTGRQERGPPVPAFTPELIAQIEQDLGDVTRGVDFPMTRGRGGSTSTVTSAPAQEGQARNNPGRGRATTIGQAGRGNEQIQARNFEQFQGRSPGQSIRQPEQSQGRTMGQSGPGHDPPYQTQSIGQNRNWQHYQPHHIPQTARNQQQYQSQPIGQTTARYNQQQAAGQMIHQQQYNRQPMRQPTRADQQYRQQQQPWGQTTGQQHYQQQQPIGQTARPQQQQYQTGTGGQTARFQHPPGPMREAIRDHHQQYKQETWDHAARIQQLLHPVAPLRLPGRTPAPEPEPTPERISPPATANREQSSSSSSSSDDPFRLRTPSTSVRMSIIADLPACDTARRNADQQQQQTQQQTATSSGGEGWTCPMCIKTNASPSKTPQRQNTEASLTGQKGSNWENLNRRAAAGARDPSRCLRAGDLGPPAGSRVRRFSPTASATESDDNSSDTNNRETPRINAPAWDALTGGARVPAPWEGLVAASRQAADERRERGQAAATGPWPGGWDWEPMMSAEEAAIAVADRRRGTIFVDRGVDRPGGNDDEEDDRA